MSSRETVERLDAPPAPNAPAAAPAGDPPAGSPALPGFRAPEAVTGPKVSVIIPCYNQAEFLGEAIESVLRQTSRSVEIVVVDDGSTDGTAAVAARYPGVVYRRQDNQGPNAARNTGIRASSGEFLVFLDADDRLLPDALEAGLDCFAAHPDAAFVSGGHRRIEADGRPIGTPIVPRVDLDPYVALLRGNYIGMHATVMYRRSVLEAVGGFDPALRECEEYELFLRIARERPVYHHERLVAEYRQHDANRSRDIGRMLTTALRVLRSQAPYVQGDPRRLEAYRAGRRLWKASYGDELMRQIRRHLRRPDQAGYLVRCAALLLRHAPRQLARRAAREAGWRGSRVLGPFLPAALHRRLGAPYRRRADAPPPGLVDFGALRRTAPISRVFGYDRGLPVDRYYIERFLAANAGLVRGRVLEVGDDTYTRRFGGSRVTRRDVLHVREGNPLTTIVADLTRADHIPSNSFDCIILTQTLQYIYELRAAVATLHRILKPGGTLLATVPGISQIDRAEWGTYWAFTTLSARRLLEEVFPARDVTVEAHGNVLAAVSLLHGLAACELDRHELDQQDPLYQVLITIRATRPEAPA